MTRSLRLLFVVGCMVALGACSHLPRLGDGSLARPDLSPQQRVRVALDLLDRGEQDHAKAELEAALAANPGDNTATRLLEQINADPQLLLGVRNRPYVVRNGETMGALAERFLGDPLLFYALSRYNDIEAPNSLAAGQSILIPDRRVSASVRIPPASSAPNTRSAATSVTPSLPSANAARANQLRLAGLEQLNAGAADRAVALLRQAQSLDASNALIQRDLERAMRVQAALGRRS